MVMYVFVCVHFHILKYVSITWICVLASVYRERERERERKRERPPPHTLYGIEDYCISSSTCAI